MPTSAQNRELDVPLAVVGCDFRVASTAWRNELMIPDAAQSELAEKLAGAGSVDGFVILQTCNRVEWILSGPRPAWAAELARAQLRQRWLSAQMPLPHPQPYAHVSHDAVAHLVRVALGLESFVRGEREIAGQLNRAFTTSRRLKLASANLNALQTVLGRVVKRVQRLTNFGARARGVHSLAVAMVLNHLGPAPGRCHRLGVVGMGEIGRKVASLAEQSPALRVTRFNRSVHARHADHWLPLSELPRHIADLDALVVATGSASVVLHAAHLANATEGMPIVDVGTPNQVDVRGSPAIRRGLDDLLDGACSPGEDLDAVAAFAEDAVQEYRIALKKREVASLLRATQDHYDLFAHGSLPALLARTGNSELIPALRGAVRAYTRSIVSEIERAVDPRD